MRLRAWPLAPLLAAALVACGGTPQKAASPGTAALPPINSLTPSVAFVGSASPSVTVATEASNNDGGLDVTINGNPAAADFSTGFPVIAIPTADLNQSGTLEVQLADARTGARSQPFPFYVLPAAQAGAAVRLLVSANLSGQPDDGANNSAPAISATGRYVAFQSLADDLVPGPASGYADIYVRDTCLGAPTPCTPSTIRASVATGGALANGHSYDPTISADGRYVAFDSNATNLAPGVPAASPTVHPVYLRDTCIGAPSGCAPSTILVSVTPAGSFATGDEPSLSATGRYLAMIGAPALAGSTIAGDIPAIVRDTCIGAVSPCLPGNLLASANGSGQLADYGGASYVRISPDGRYVVFSSSADNIDPSATDHMPHIYLRDTCIGAAAGCVPSTTLVDVGGDGQPANGHGDSNIDFPAVSAGGRYVAFSSAADVTNLGGAPNHGDLYLRDTCNGAPAGCTPATAVISVPFSGRFSNSGSDSASMTPDGRYIAFASLATNLVLDDPSQLNSSKDIFVRDTCNGAPAPCTPVTTWASVANWPNQPYQPSYSACSGPAISADGHYVAYLSDSGAYSLAIGVASNGSTQVYLATTGF
ncbi:MAG: hypothetical protein ACRD2F_06640 [Terriglobales bacterium]